jgi:hypothetical protein
MAPSGIGNPQVFVFTFYFVKGDVSRPPVVAQVFPISPQVSIPNFDRNTERYSGDLPDLVDNLLVLTPPAARLRLGMQKRGAACKR